MPNLPDSLISTFEQQFGGQPNWLVRAPGRVNLIGEHTDYNAGFVLPMAIEHAVYIALRASPTPNQVRVYSQDYAAFGEFDLTQMQHQGHNWIEYLKGTAWALQHAGHRLQGWEGVLAGNVPQGAGLSSSAALELATARAFATVSQLAWQPTTMAQIGQQAENQWVGVNCGIMDQMISAAGQANHALLIDCRSLATTAVPLPPDTLIAILDTSTRRGLVDSAYNERRMQCQQAADYFGVAALRDVTPTDFERRAHELPKITHRRAKHVIYENARTLQAAAALKHNDPITVGQLMRASHTSLQMDFEVSSPELDAMAAIANQHSACYGARMTGAGFGGCAVALIHAAQSTEFAQAVHREYGLQTGQTAKIYLSQATAGASVKKLHK